jgi:hypothetical protein
LTAAKEKASEVSASEARTQEKAESQQYSALAAPINELHRQAQALAHGALEAARQAGELLLDVRRSLPHGAWLPWVAEHCSFSPRQAQRYVLIAERWASIATKYDRVSHLSVRAALRLIRPPASELERAQQWAARHAALCSEAQLLSRAADSALADPAATAEEAADIALRALRLEADAHALREHAIHECERLTRELSEAVGLPVEDLLSALEDGSFERACDERIAALGGAS